MDYKRYNKRILNKIINQDSLFIASKSEEVIPELSGKKVLVTGGTGFFGKNLIHAISYINSKLKTPIKLWIMSRNPQNFLTSFESDLNSINFIEADLENKLEFENDFQYIINAAIISGEELETLNPKEIEEKILKYSENIIDFAIRNKNTKVLHFSTGAVYGKLTKEAYIETDALPKSYSKDNFGAYAKAKKISEELFLQAYKDYKLQYSICRCFSFIGPHLPLDRNFAAGNFINNIINNEDIIIKTDGSAVRSYLYSADFVVWALHLLVLGKNTEIYNLGSDQACSIRELAKLNAKNSNHETEIKILGKKDKRSNSIYLPSIEKACNQFKLAVWHDLETSIKRSLEWNNIERSVKN